MSFLGQLNRKPHWLSVPVMLGGLALTALGLFLLTGGTTVGITLLGILYPASVRPALAIGVKRGHDRDRSTRRLSVLYRLPMRVEVLAGNGGNVPLASVGGAGLAISIGG